MLKGNNKKEAFLNENFSHESESLKKTRESIQNKFDKDISIMPYEAQMLQFFIKTYNIKSILEVGTFGGYSTIAMAEALPDDGELISLEKDEDNATFAQKNIQQSGLENKINIIVGDAHQSLASLADKNQKFDLVFIDAEKKGYLKYLEASLKVTSKGSIIIADNVFLNKAVYDGSLITQKNKGMVEVMTKFLNSISNQDKYETIVIPTEEGMSVSKRL